MPEIKFKLSENEIDFGEIREGACTNYMFVMHHRTEGGWMFPRIVPVGDFCFAPDSFAVRFGQTVVDTVKVSRDKDGNAVLFCHDRVIDRLCESAKQLRLPEPDRDLLNEALKILADSERGFLTDDAYLSAEITLGAENAVRSDLTIQMRYIKKRETDKGITLAFGEAPTVNRHALSSAFLGACMLDKMQAQRQEFDSPLWLDCVYNKFILSAADMNIFFRTDSELITPDAPIVNGIMRECVISLAKSWDINISVRGFSVDELKKLYNENKITEVFVSSVRHGIVPVTRIEDMDFAAGKLAHKLNRTISGVETGTFIPPEKWTEKV